MANKKISALTDGTTAEATDAIPIARGVANYYITPGYIRAYLLGTSNLYTKAQTFQPDSDAQAGTFRRYNSTQTANIVEIQTEANAFLAAFDKLGALTIGAASGNTGAMKLKGTTSGTVTVTTADAAGTWTLKLPTTGGTDGYVLKTDGTGVTSWVSQAGGGTANIAYVIDGGGAAIATGVAGVGLRIPFACTITGWTILADVSGSCVIDVYKSNLAGYPPTSSITASAKPTLTTATNASSTTLTGWTTSISDGDILRFNVDSASTVTQVYISLKVTKS